MFTTHEGLERPNHGMGNWSGTVTEEKYGEMFSCIGLSMVCGDLFGMSAGVKELQRELEKEMEVQGKVELLGQRQKTMEKRVKKIAKTMKRKRGVGSLQGNKKKLKIARSMRPFGRGSMHSVYETTKAMGDEREIKLYFWNVPISWAEVDFMKLLTLYKLPTVRELRIIKGSNGVRSGSVVGVVEGVEEMKRIVDHCWKDVDSSQPIRVTRYNMSGYAGIVTSWNGKEGTLESGFEPFRFNISTMRPNSRKLNVGDAVTFCMRQFDDSLDHINQSVAYDVVYEKISRGKECELPLEGKIIKEVSIGTTTGLLIDYWGIVEYFSPNDYDFHYAYFGMGSLWNWRLLSVGYVVTFGLQDDDFIYGMELLVANKNAKTSREVVEELERTSLVGKGGNVVKGGEMSEDVAVWCKEAKTASEGAIADLVIKLCMSFAKVDKKGREVDSSGAAYYESLLSLGEICHELKTLFQERKQVMGLSFDQFCKTRLKMVIDGKVVCKDRKEICRLAALFVHCTELPVLKTLQVSKTFVDTHGPILTRLAKLPDEHELKQRLNNLM